MRSMPTPYRTPRRISNSYMEYFCDNIVVELYRLTAGDVCPEILPEVRHILQNWQKKKYFRKYMIASENGKSRI